MKYDLFKNFNYREKVSSVIELENQKIVVAVGDKYLMNFQVRLNRDFRPEFGVYVCDKNKNYRFKWIIYGKSLSEEERAWLIEFRNFCVDLKDNAMDDFRDSEVFDELFG